MDGDGDGITDYSDFEFQQLQYELTATPDGSNSNVNVQAGVDVEPLQGQAGLDNNEVAELVYYSISANIEPEDEEDDQNAATATELRGTFGINLPKSQDGLVGNAPQTEGDVFFSRGATDDSGMDVKVLSEDRILDTFQCRAGLPFDDEANGTGGTFSHDGFYTEKAFRPITGRGPVLDAGDDLTMNQVLVSGDTIIRVSSQVKVQLMWDVSTVDDAGRQFSVPMD